MEKVLRDRIIAVVLMAACLYLGRDAMEFPMDGGYFPLFALAGIFVFSLYLLVLSFLPGSGGPKAAKAEQRKAFNYRPFVLFWILVLQVVFMRDIGYFLSTTLFLVAASLFLGIRNYRVLFITILILIPSMYAFLVWGLQASLPQGVLF
jgi:hypothetical protein